MNKILKIAKRFERIVKAQEAPKVEQGAGDMEAALANAGLNPLQGKYKQSVAEKTFTAHPAVRGLEFEVNVVIPPQGNVTFVPLNVDTYPQHKAAAPFLVKALNEIVAPAIVKLRNTVKPKTETKIKYGLNFNF